MVLQAKLTGQGMKKLNYLLVMPRLVQKIGDGYSFPLGIAYISSSMKKAGYKVITLNLNHRDGEVSDIIKREIQENEIDVVATGGLSFQYSTLRSIIEAAKQADSKIITIVGGGIISGDPETAMEALEDVDYGIIGEGEITICELCEALENSKEVSGVSGLIYRCGNGYKMTRPRKEIQNIDCIPWPDYEGFELDNFLAASPGISGLNRKNTVFMIASRSCPYNCTFCFHTVGNKYRQRSLESFFEELDYLVSKYDIEYICLADELFAHNIKRLEEFCERMGKYNIRWWAQFRVDNITQDLLFILKGGGCDVMSFGLESADNRILKSMRKGITVQQTERSLKLVYDAGISFEGAFIFGDIEETWGTATNTLSWWRKHSEYKITLNLITVYPGSYLYQYAYKKGIIKDRVRFLKDGCPQVNVSKLTDGQFSELLKTIMEAPVNLTKVLSTIEVGGVDYKTGRIDVKGVCTACRQENNWKNVKLFSANFLACQHCGQRYNIVVPARLRMNIENNIVKLLQQYGRLAIWGINYHTADLFKNSGVLREANIYPIDISETKRKMDLYGKNIYSPEIINTDNIELVIVSIPVYFTQIDRQVKSSYKNVRKVIDICNLIDPNYQ
jgi:radical SAM superfamily enzyme YgiQ (UPF0313 family)